MYNKFVTMNMDNTVLSSNSFSTIEGGVEMQLLSFPTGKELWIHSEENGSITFDINEAIRLRDYLNSLDLK